MNNINKEILKLRDDEASLIDKQSDMMVYTRSLYPKRPIKRILCCVGVMVLLLVLLSYTMGNIMSTGNVEISLNHIITPHIEITEETVVENIKIYGNNTNKTTQWMNKIIDK